MKFILSPKRCVLLVLLFAGAYIHSLRAQTLHQLYQRPGTELLLRQHLIRSGLPDTGTATLVLLPPMACPRCEGLINPFIAKLKAVSRQEPTALFAFYPLKEPAISYLKRRNFKTDILVVPDKDDLLSAFSFSTQSIQVPFFVRVDMGKGRLLHAAPALGIALNDAWVNAFVADTLPEHFRIPENKKSDKEPVQLQWVSGRGTAALPLNILTFQKAYPVKSTSGFEPSLLEQLDFLDNHLLALDDLSQSILHFSITNETLLLDKIIHPGSKGERKYIAADVPDSTLDLLKRMNLVNTMLFRPQFLNSHTIFFSGSFPEVYWTNKASEELDYKNKLVFAFTDVARSSLRTKPIQHHDSIDINHTAPILAATKGLVFMPVKKGWPLKGTAAEPPVNNEKQNPFLEKFYDFTPAFAVFDTAGKFVTYLGTLSGFYKNHRLGYAYADFDLQINGDSIALLDKTLGVLEIYHWKDMKKLSSHQLWQTNVAPDIEKSLKYITGFQSKMSAGAIGFTLQGDTLYYLIKTNGGVYLKMYLLKTQQQAHTYYVPDRINELELVDWQFRINDGTLYLCALGIGKGEQVMYMADLQKQ